MKLRWVALVAGLGLVAVAFVAGGRVADTREGLVAEIVALLGGLAGVCFILYGLVAGARTGPSTARTSRPIAPAPTPRPASDLAFGAGGVLVAILLVAGLAVSGGWLWAGLGAVLLVPMMAGSVFLCVRFARSAAELNSSRQHQRSQPDHDQRPENIPPDQT